MRERREEGPIYTLDAKKEAREMVGAAVDEYLKGGGEVTHCAAGLDSIIELHDKVTKAGINIEYEIFQKIVFYHRISYNKLKIAKTTGLDVKLINQIIKIVSNGQDRIYKRKRK